MAATDTIVGIVGAVLLAVVMVGVFVYEYNNAPAAASPDAELREHFHEDYPALNATGDLNGNGVPNYRDPDMDGDGIANDGDTATAVTVRFSGTAPAPSPPASTSVTEFKLHVEAGHVTSSFTLSYNSTLPAPIPQVPRTPTLEIAVLGPDGPVSGAPQTTQSGTAVTSTTTTDHLEPGDYTIRVTETVASPQGAPFTVVASLDYGNGHPGNTHGPGH
jgi:hypothetical protein